MNDDQRDERERVRNRKLGGSGACSPGNVKLESLHARNKERESPPPLPLLSICSK